jgi:hypothetical protein
VVPVCYYYVETEGIGFGVLRRTQRDLLSLDFNRKTFNRKRLFGIVGLQPRDIESKDIGIVVGEQGGLVAFLLRMEVKASLKQTLIGIVVDGEGYW